MKIALIADWLVVFGGAEHTIEEFLTLWPGAPLFTTVAQKGNLGPLDGADIRTSNLQLRYQLLKKHQPLIFQMPRAVEQMDLTGYDVILSSSHAVAKGIIPPSTAAHVCYCHTPVRYAWEMEEEYLEDFRVPRLLRNTIKHKLAALRRWDLSTAKRVDTFIANSTETQQRIKKIYGRESVVIPPPVHDRFLEAPLSSGPRDAYLAIGRLVPYKRFDLLIELANARKLPLTIAGTGQEEARLKKMAGPTVRFLGFVPDAKLPALYGSAKALLFPQHEDAGIVPLEAQACGTPVIAYSAGGVQDTVSKDAGVFFEEQTVASLGGAVERFAKRAFDAAAIREHAEKFSSRHFREQIKEIVEKAARKYARSL